MNIAIKVGGSDQLVAKFQKFEGEILNFTPDFKVLGELLKRYYATAPFFSNGSIYGESWAPLAESTLSQKGKRYPGTPPLIRTGAMAQSFQADASRTTLVISNRTDYFKYHQSALPRSGRLPRRKVMGVNKQVSDQVLAVLKKGIVARYKAIQ